MNDTARKVALFIRNYNRTSNPMKIFNAETTTELAAKICETEAEFEEFMNLAGFRQVTIWKIVRR